MIEALAQVRRDLRVQFLPAERGGGVAVGDEMPQLLAQVHRVDRHHHGVGAQDGVIADHELRAVLHVQQNPVAFAHPAMALQEPGERVDLALELAETERAAIEDDERLVRVACGRDFEVVVEAGPGQRQVLAQALRPVLVVPILHDPPPAVLPRARGAAVFCSRPQPYCRVTHSATQAGLSDPSRSTVTPQVSCVPPLMCLNLVSTKRPRMREPAGTASVKRTRFSP